MIFKRYVLNDILVHICLNVLGKNRLDISLPSVHRAGSANFDYPQYIGMSYDVSFVAVTRATSL